MSLLSRLFGGGGGAEKTRPAVEPEMHEGFAIYPEPKREAGGYRIAARIEKTIEGEARSHAFVRADTVSDPDAAVEFSVRKARQLIDEQGEGLFG